MKRVKFTEPQEAGPSDKEEIKKAKKHTLDSDEEDSSDEETAKE